ncbi:MAG: PEP-CTERM sorting domain-containing protein [Bryobacteraceae bacterium]
MKIVNVRTVFLASVSLAFALASAKADVITVDNPSFETLPASGLHATAGCVTRTCVYDIGPIPNWTNTGVSGQWQPGGPSGTGLSWYNSVPSPTIAFTSYPDSSTSGPTISQIVSATVVDGGVYTLSVDVGHRSDDVAFTPDPGLLIGGVFYAATGVDPGSGNWDTWTATFTGSAATAGDAIEIELSSSGGGQGNFDNVVLTGTPVGSAVPEPASDGLLALGLCGLIVLPQLYRRAGPKA